MSSDAKGCGAECGQSANERGGSNAGHVIGYRCCTNSAVLEMGHVGFKGVGGEIVEGKHLFVHFNGLVGSSRGLIKS